MEIITRKVISGKNIANKLGFPTANLEYKKQDNIEFGVYSAKVNFNNKTFSALAHIGPSKTFDIKEPRIEVHIFNINQNIYGKTIKVKLIKKIRNSKKFTSKKALVNQIKKDVLKIQNIL